MKKRPVLLILCCIVITYVIACSKSDSAREREIYGNWSMEKIVYDDGTVSELPAGNFVEINEDHIVEKMAGFVNRQYQFSRNERVLTLISGGEEVIWEVTKIDNDGLEIATPIGTYILFK